MTMNENQSLKLIRYQCISVSVLSFFLWVFFHLFLFTGVNCTITMEQYQANYTKMFSSTQDYHDKCVSANANGTNVSYILLIVPGMSIIIYLNARRIFNNREKQK